MKKKREEEDADEGEVAGAVDGFARLRLLDAHVDADVQHRQRLCDAGPDQRAAAAQRVGDEDEEDGDADELDEAVDARGEELVL